MSTEMKSLEVFWTSRMESNQARDSSNIGADDMEVIRSGQR